MGDFDWWFGGVPGWAQTNSPQELGCKSPNHQSKPPTKTCPGHQVNTPSKHCEFPSPPPQTKKQQHRKSPTLLHIPSHILGNAPRGGRCRAPPQRRVCCLRPDLRHCQELACQELGFVFSPQKKWLFLGPFKPQKG